MADPSVEFEPFVDERVRKFITDGVDFHNIAVTGLSAYQPANFVLRGDDGEVLGGLLGEIWGGWLHVGTLWVAQPARGRGHASALLEAAEAYALRCGCVGASLDTFSFQARPLYERHGYTVFGTQSDHPPGHTLYFMEKRLGG